MQKLAQEECSRLQSDLTHIVNITFPDLLKPHSTTSHLSALVELKSGVGGAESSLFLSDMLRMYQRYADSAPEGWRASLVSTNENEGGGLKEAILEVTGPGAYDALRWESGVHRVQRVPATEASGRTHTSTVAVIVSSYANV
jgi:peptide chain release factor 1